MAQVIYADNGEPLTCGCDCNCHAEELTGLASGDPWPGPCAACCEPGMDCACGRALAFLLERMS